MESKFSLKKLCPKLILRLACFLLVLGVYGFFTVQVCLMTKETESSIGWNLDRVNNRLFLGIQETARLLLHLNSSALNLARSLSSIVNGTELSFAALEKKIAPTLFLALSTIPQISQVSFIGSEGLLFSYYKDRGQTLAVFSNSSSPSHWYTKLVNPDTGKLYGKAVASPPRQQTSWFLQVLTRPNGYSSLGTGWNKAPDRLFVRSVAMDGEGVISIGFPVKVVVDHFAVLDFHDGDFYLATAAGDVIVQTRLPNAQIVVNDSIISVQTVTQNGHPLGYLGNRSCDSGEVRHFMGRIMGIKYNFYCSALEIAGVHLVYLLSFPNDGMAGLVEKNSRLSVLFLVLMFLFVVVSFIVFIFFIIRAARREMFLCAAFVKQLNATQQAERKSMFKTRAYTRANHDVCGSLAVISGWLELCHNDAESNSELASNLQLLKACTRDLLDILNSALKISKIEAGKMDLEEEEFNLAQLLEDVVDMFYPAGTKKHVDIVLDPCDGSILKFPIVKGDRVKLKQILCNLLSNAIKHTSEGHISVRAIVKKKSFEKDIISYNRNRCLSWLFCKDKEHLDDLNALHKAEHDPNKMEFEFEVDDTGVGIPKDKQESIFEEYFQVKETNPGEEEGCGLGLGIVQSIVRLMDGEIRIVGKGAEEKGTCFRFGVLLTTCQPESDDTEEDSARLNYQHLSFMRNLAVYKPEGSHVMLYITGEERRRVLKRYFESLSIKVTIITQEKSLYRQLEMIKQKLDPFHHVPLRDSGSSTNDAQSIRDGNDNILLNLRKSNSRSSSLMLIVIDSCAGNFAELCSAVSDFKKDIPNHLCKIVWLDNPVTRSTEVQAMRITPPCDCVMNKPFHGSRLIQVLKLLAERKGTSQRNFPSLSHGATAQEAPPSVVKHSPSGLSSSGPELVVASSSQETALQQIVIQMADEKSVEKPLSGKKILVVEDTLVVQKLTVACLRKLGADVEACANGKEAFDKICNILRDQKERGSQQVLPYDCILMDCEMPVLNGYEATRLIRTEEQLYGIRIPIIALTTSDDGTKVTEAGMDFHLIKPLKADKFLELVQILEPRASF
ncbi:hypothetical protein SLA2020_122340 [Shorea laevis]